jgi:hypothetical protein
MATSAAVVQLSAASLSRKVDELGEINAQISTLEAKAKKLKKVLVDSQFPTVEGKRYKAVISHSVQSRLDSGLVKSLLTVQQLLDCSVQSKRTSVSLYDK